MEETNSVNGKVDESIEQKDSQTPGIETNENETLLGQGSEDSHDLFKGISVKEADRQPKEDEENNAVAEVAEERSVSRHPMTTRSKSGVLCKCATSKSHKSIGKKNSLRSFRSSSTTLSLSLRSAFSDTQLTGLCNTMKTNQDRRIEKNQLESLFLQEEALLHETWEQEYGELEGEWWKLGKMEREYYGKQFLEKEKRLRKEIQLREEEKQLQEEERIREEEEHSRQLKAERRAFQQKCEEIHHKRKEEMERLHRRRQELGNRSQREQLELDVECSETLPENRLANTSLIRNIDRPLNKLEQVAITPSANSNAVPAIATPNITTVPASTSVQFSTPLQLMTCAAANQQNRIMAPSNAAVPNSGATVNVANSCPSSTNAIVDGINAERRNSLRSETLRKMKNLGMDVDKLKLWRVIVNPEGVSTTSVIRNMDRGCLICSSRRFTESISRSKKFKINGEERFVSELDIIELPNTLYHLTAMIVWFDLETLQLFAHNLANRVSSYRITYNLDPQSCCSIQPKATSGPIFPIKKFVDLIQRKKHEGGEITGEEGAEICLSVLYASSVDCWLHGYIFPLRIHIIPEGILQVH